MSKFIVLLAVLFLLYQVGKSFFRRMLMPPRRKQQRHVDERRRPAAQAPDAKRPDVDYSKIRDADFRDLD
jgi:hypothetical protein